MKIKQNDIPTKQEQEINHIKNREEFRRKYGELPLELSKRQAAGILKDWELFITEVKDEQ